MGTVRGDHRFLSFLEALLKKACPRLHILIKNRDESHPKSGFTSANRCQSGFSLPTDPQYYLYNDLCAIDSEYATRRLVVHCTASFAEPIATDCIGGLVPMTYLLCENDNAIPASIQIMFIQHLGTGCKVVVCDTGHSPFLGQTKMVARQVRKMAGEE